MINRITPLLLFIGLVWGQDVYPYFSDMAKQLEFERTKIIIEEGEDIQQIISGGGSQFNWWSLISEREPIYKNAPIETSYKYHQYFDVKIDNKSISEIKMLKIMGLEDEADRILNDYKKQRMKYKRIRPDTTINFKYSNLAIGLKACRCLSAFTLLGAIGTLTIDAIAVWAGITYGTHLWYKNTIEKEDYYIIRRKGRKPVIKQVLSPIQTKSLADAYNRKLYNDISKQ